MAKKKYTPEATVDLLYNQLMSDYKGDAQVEAERQRQKSAEKKASGNSTNSSTSVQNTLQSPSAVSKGASTVGNIYKAPKRKYTTGKTTHGYTTARSFAKDQTTKPKTSGTRGIGSATQEAFERGLSSRSLKENAGQRSSLSNKESYSKESDLRDLARNKSYNEAKTLDKNLASIQSQKYANELKSQRDEYNRLREEHPTSEWLKEEGWGALTGFNSTLASTADWLLPDVITPKAVQNALDYYKKEDEKQQKIVEEVRGGDPLRTIGGNLGVNIIQNIPAMLLAPLTAEGTIATTAGTLLNPETLSQTGNAITRALYSVARETGNNPMFWETFLRTAGPTYDKEIESGADPVRATLSALTNGLLNAQIEIGGGIEKFDPTETFLQALARSGKEEGLEEIQQYAVEGLTNKALGSNTSKWFSTKRGEDAVINPIDMAEQGAYGALAGGLMGGGRAGMSSISRSIADARYEKAFPDAQAHTKELVEQALMQGREGQKSSDAEILASDIQERIENGEQVPTALVRQLHSEVLKAQAENEQDFNERLAEGYQQAVNEGRANTVQAQQTEEEGNVLNEVANEKADKYYKTAMETMGENASPRSARAISNVMVGIHTNNDIDTILLDQNARTAVEEMTGIDLPIKNTDAREVLETRALTNTIANRDTLLQEAQNKIRSNMRSREGAVFEKNYDNAIETIGVANAPEIYENFFSRFKNAGMVKDSDFDSAYDRIVSPLVQDFGEDLGGRIAMVFNRDFAHQAFDAGRQAYLADEAKASAKAKAVSAEYAGTVTYKHDTESRLSNKQKDFMTKFAERAKVGIEFYDGTQEGEDDSANGYYENGVIHININATNKLITVAKHELTHHIKVTAPEMYRKLEDFVIKKWYNNDPDAFDKKVMDYQRKWNCSVEVAYEEIIANASEAFFTDKGTIDDAVKFSKKLGHTIHDGIRSLLDTFLDIQDTDRIGDRGYGEFLKELNILKESQRMWLEALNESVERTRGNATETAESVSGEGTFTDDVSGENVRFSIREEAPPKRTKRGYKVFVVKNGELYPPMVANPNGEPTPVGVWLNADEGVRAGASKTGRPQVKAGGKGTQGGSGTLAYRPGWHLGEMPLAQQFARKDSAGNKTLFPSNFVWAECEISADHNYQEEAMSYGYTENGKFRHSYAGLPRIPKDGYYQYRTNPDPNTVPWLITGAMKINRILSDAEVKDILEKYGIEAPQRQGGNKTLEELGITFNESTETRLSQKDSDGRTLTDAQAEYFKDSKVRDKDGNLLVVYHGTDEDFYKFDPNGSYRDFLSSLPQWARKEGDDIDTIGFNWATPEKVYAKRFGDNVKEGYLNITKMLDIGVIDGYADYDDAISKLAKIVNLPEQTLRDMDEGLLDGTIYNITRSKKFADHIKSLGYDGVMAQENGVTTYGFLNSNQFKNIDNTNPTKNEDIRLSKKDQELDTQYLDAVNKGDMETAQRMVDEQAKKNGLTSRLMHGTNSFGFTTVEYGKGDDHISFFATDSEEVASSYVRPMFDVDEPNTYVRSIGKPIKNRVNEQSPIGDIISALNKVRQSSYKVATEEIIKNETDEQFRYVLEDAKELDRYTLPDKVQDVIEKVANSKDPKEAISLMDSIKDVHDIYYNDMLFYQATAKLNVLKSDVDLLKRELQWTPDNVGYWEINGHKNFVSSADVYEEYLDETGLSGRGIYELYASTNNPLTVYCNGSTWNNIKTTDEMADDLGQTATTRQIAKWAYDHGYGTVIFDYVRDTGKYGDRFTNPSTVYAFLEGGDNVIKSADPVTYDDDGNIIPLSKRFNERDLDIRYSHKTEHEPLPKARTIPQKIKNVLKKIGADKLGIKSLKAPVQISVRDLRTLWYDLNGSQEGERLNAVLEEVGNELQRLAGKYTYVSLADALEGTIHYRVDENGKPTSIVLSCKVQNAEYDINFDFTTICAKRAPLQKVLERFIKTEGKKNGESLYDELRLDEEGLYTLRAIMEQEGFDVSCIGCFVEQNRYAQQIQSKTVADDWNKAIDEYEKEHGIKITEGFNFQSLDINSLPYNEIQQGFRQYSALMKGKPTTVENKNRALIEAIPYLRKRLSPSDYASIAGQKGMMAMGNGKTNLYNLLKRGQGDSKQSTPFVPYNGEVALLPETKKGKPMFDYLFGIGGARAQSASDFQIEYVFDYMQLVGDLAGRGLPMHMYTKVIECAELLGKCGIKINLSAMCDVDDSVDSEFAGLKRVGNKWVYNISDQSIDYNKAVKLQRQEGYSKNIGIIMVVLSKQHMLKSLSDNDVRYIIGYHSSKMPAVVAKASNMGRATDYTKINKTNRLNEKGRALFDEAMRRAKGNTGLERYKDALRIFDDLIQQDKLNEADVRRGNEYARYMSSYKNNTADFDVYEDIKKTNDARATADNYIKYCMDNDLVPMYFPFAFHENYYKCEVYDYNVYDNVDENGKPTGNGKYAPMEAVQNVYPDLNIAEGETDSKKFMARVSKMLKAQNEKNKALEPKYERVERRAIAELSITGNDYMDMDASGIDHAELEHRVDMTEEAVEERRRSIKEKELNAKTIEYQSTIRKLEKNVEGLKAQFKRTNKKPNPVEARRQAGRLIQRHASNMRIHEDVANTLTEIYEMYAKRGAKAFDDIYAIAERTAVEIVNNISEVHFEGKEEYDQIKDYLKDTQIVVTDEMKRNITDFNDFRKRYFGKLKLVNGTIGNIDSVYEELKEMFPSQFTDEYVNPADQLNHIADVLDSYAPFYETLDGASEEMQDYVVAVASDLMETAYNLQKSKTFADKKYDEKVKAVKKAREKALANKKEALSKLRARYSSRMAEAVRDAKSETKAKIDEKAQKKRRIAQIAKTHKRLADKLFTPSDTKHLPDGYDKAVANVLHMFDFTTSRMEKWAETHDDPSKRMQALRDLRKRLESYVRASEDGNNEGVDLGMEVDSDLVGIVDELEGALGENVKLADLDSATLEDIATLFRAFEHQLNSYNKAFNEEKMETISQSVDKVVREAKEQKHGKWHTGVMGRVFTSNMNPSDFFTLMGGEIEQLYKNVRKGFDKYEKNLAKAKDFIQDRVDVKTAEKWMNHKQTFTTTDGEKITLTDTQLMSLYCLMKREQAQGHIFGQGIVSAPVRVKEKIKAETLDRTRVQPTPEDVTEWLKTLSKDQIKFADEVQKFFVDEISEWGNETSMTLYGYKKFTEKNYFPIQSSQDYLNSNFDAKGNDPTLKNISPTKATVKNANNPLMVDDIFSVFAKHTAQMASYNAYVPSITDFQRVWNYKTESPSGRKTSTQEVFRDTYGDGITRYVTNFFADLNGVYKRNLDISTGDKMFGLFKKSAVGGNLRVLTQQPMAIARAMLIVDPLKLAVSVPKTVFQARRTYNEMLEHCPIAEWKTWGFYSMDIAGASRDLKNVMIGKDSVMDKVFMNMYGVADNVTWTCIFNACKMQVEAENKGIEKGTPEYWDKVNELASEVFDRTQVVDSPFHRSELMKSQDTGKKYLTMFMAEPTKTINMLNTELTLVAREIADKKPGKATARFTRLTATTIANAMLLAVGQSVIDAMRSAGGGSDDDDKGDFEERFRKHWMTNTKDNLNVANMIPLVKDVMSLIDGYGVTRPDMMGIEKCVKAVQRLKKYYDNPDESTYTQLEVMTNTALTFMYVLGVPLTNAKRDLESIALTGAEAVDNPDVFLWYMKNKYQVNKNTQYIWADAYYDALDKGNDATAKKIYNYMISQGLTKKYIQNRKKTWEKHRYGEDSNGTDSED